MRTMVVLKFILGLLIAVMMVVYEWWPGKSPAAEATVLINREAAVYALFAAAFFLVAMMPTGKPSGFSRALRSFTQLAGTFATFMVALHLLGEMEGTFSDAQLIAVWLAIGIGIIAGIIAFVVTVFGPWFGRFPEEE